MRRYIKTNELYHHGIKGQKWGVRRYQKVGGGLTPAGKKRYKKEKGPNDVRAKKHEKLKGEARREQMKALSERKDIRKKDRKLAAYGAKSTAERLAITTGKTTFKSAVREAATTAGINAAAKAMKIPGKAKFSMSAKDTGIDAVKKYLEQESKLKALSESYNPDGTGKKNRIPTIQRKAKEVAITTAASATVTLGVVTVAKSRIEAGKNRRKFESWGGNLLEAKYDSIVPISESEYRVSD
jgi:hypothetical protein